MYNTLNQSVKIEIIETKERLSICLIKSKGIQFNINDKIVVKSHQIIKREFAHGTELFINEKHVLGVFT